MAKFTLDDIKHMVHNPGHIRNMGIVAHIDHGKSTLADNLLARAGMISEELAGEQLFMDFDPQESERGITIYSANVSMIHEYQDDKHLINLIDTPGHVDFGGDVTRAMRAVDGALVVVDAVEGCMPQTETVLKQALKERVKPVLFINKVDRLIKELQLDPQGMQEKFTSVIAEVNNLLKEMAPEEYKKEWQVSVENGEVAFGSALRNWAISVPFMQQSGITFKDIIDYVEQDKDKELAQEAPLHEVVLNMVIEHLPDPETAQNYRIPNIWKGDESSEIGQSMRGCQEDGELVAVVTNVINDPHAGTVCTARIFSGSVEESMVLRGVGSKTDQRLQQVGIYSGPRKMKIDAVPSGNIAALTGVDFSTGDTVVAKGTEIEPFERIEHVFEPVVTKSIEPKKTSDLPKLIKILKNRAKEDNTIVINIDEETGETLVSGLGELHIEAKVERFLREAGIEIDVSPPIVVYREGVAQQSPVQEGKSPNKHNRFYLTVEPVPDQVYQTLLEGELPEGKIRDQDKSMVRDTLIKCGMDKSLAEGVKAIFGTSLYIDTTRGIQYLSEIDELIFQGIESVVNEGPLANEPSAGLMVKLHDAKLHEDAIHRGPAQVMPAIRAAMIKCILSANGELLEPKQVLRVDVPQDQMGGAIKEVSNRRGQILDMQEEEGDSFVRAKMPVAELFGFEAALKSATGGKGFFSLIDQVFEPLPGNLQEETIINIRKRKGMKPEAPKLEDFE